MTQPKFCCNCSNLMKKEPIGITINYTCASCNTKMEANDYDVLMSEGYIEVNESPQKHNILIQNTLHDPAARIEKQSCPNCNYTGINYINIGEHLTSYYICSVCKSTYSYQDLKQINAL